MNTTLFSKINTPDLIDMSIDAYNNPKDNVNISKEYEKVGSGTSATISGYKYAVYQNGNNIILAFAGTDSLGDLVSDIQMGISDKIPAQYQEALNTYLDLKANNPNANITVTGHSLGGSLAQLVGATTGANAVAFNPYGVSNLLPQLGLKNDVPYPNIENYNLSSDLLNLVNHGQGVDNIGENYIIPVNNKNPLESHNDFESLKTGEPIKLEDWRKQNAGLIGTLQAACKIGQFVFMGCLAKLPSGMLLTLPGTLLGYFNQAQSTQPITIDPILVDLNGDGIIGTVGVKDGVYFDHQKDGFAETSAWVDENDGILAIDKNGDGVINDGGEIFGDNYVKRDGTVAKNGFDALKDLDSNNDGIINAKDAEFNNIKILKGDGTLLTLEEAGIVSIKLSSIVKNTKDKNGNTLVSSSTFTKADGSVGNLGDFNLVVDKMNSFATEWVEVSEDVELLPDVMGFGMVHSLHQAIVRDESGILKGLVEEFISAKGSAAKKEILGNILYKWTGADKVAEGSRGDDFDAKKLYVLEQFIGRGYVGTNGSNPHTQAAEILNNAFNVLMNNVYASLMSQTELNDVFDLLEIVYDEDTETVSYDLCKVREYIDNLINEDEIRGKQLFGNFTQSFVNLGLRDNSNYTEYYNYFVSKGNDYRYLLETADKNVVQGTDEADVIEGTTGADAVFGGGGDDSISTRQGNDLVYGGDGNDTIDTCQGDDVVYGGGGNDSILGGEGNNVLYGEDGNDTIIGGNDNDTIYGGDGNDLIKSGRGYDIIYGGLGNDTIDLDYGNSTVYGGDGNDSITIVDGTNHIDAGDGDDTIVVHAYDTDTTIIGGLGNDSIKMSSRPYSQAGNVVKTVCKYNLGDGDDTIYVNNFTKNQVLEFGEGITRNDIYFSGLNDNLIIYFKNNEGSITLINSFGSTGIEKFVFSNGDEILRSNAMYGLKTYGDDNDNYIEGSRSNEAIYGYGGNDTIYAKDSNDTIYGGDGDDYIDPGRGNDFVYAGNGNDTIKFGDHDVYNPSNYIDGGDGDDYIETNDGNNTVIGGKGNDSIKASYNYSSNDTFIYNLGDGNDTIIDEKGDDTLQFGEGITMENVIFRGSDYDLLITFKDNEGSIRIKNALYNGNYKIEKFKFADGEEFSSEYIISHLAPVEGTNGNDSINGSYASEVIYGYGGNDTINGGYGNDTIYGGDGDDSILGGEGNDIIYGEDGNDFIDPGKRNNYVYGGLGNDTIKVTDIDYQASKYIDGGEGDDVIEVREGYNTIIGGKGDDYLSTPYGGNDTYIYNFGDGNDTIRNWKGDDVLQFGEGITRENTVFRGSEQDLLITFKDNEGSIRIKNTLYNSDNKIEKFKFADGEELSYEYAISHLAPVEGTEGNDSINGSYASEVIYGYGGNDTINGGTGNDTIYGGDGNDTLINTSNKGSHYLDGGNGNDYFKVHSGNDTIVGGAGDDTVQCNSNGNNTYIYNLGDGNDVINEYGGNDAIQFGEGITKDNILVSGNKNNDLILTFKDNEGSIRIAGCLLNTGKRVENFRFANGTVLTYDEMLKQSGIRIEGDNEQNKLEGTDIADVIYGYGGNDSINGRNGDDTIYGGDGNDTIDGWYGNDVIYGENGNDLITGGNSNDTVYGGDGNDTIKFINGINTLSGDKGDDYIQGGTNADTYLYNLGDGNDIILDSAGNDTIVFGEGITSNNIITETVGENLKISFNEFDGSITINKAATNANYRVENFRFADGSNLTYDEMLDLKNSQAALKVDQNAISQIQQDNINGIDNQIASGISNSDINKIIQDMTAYNTAEEGIISYCDNVNQEKELMTLVGSSM